MVKLNTVVMKGKLNLFNSRCLSLSILFSLFFVSYSNAINYYVNDNSFAEPGSICSAVGNNSNSGTATNAPYLTLTALIADKSLGSGDVVYIDAGTYTDNSLLSGNSTDYSFTIEGVLVNGVSVSLFDYGGGDARFMVLTRGESDNITLKNLYIKGYKPLAASSYGGFLNNSASTGGDGNASGWTIQNCIIDDCDAQNSGGGIYWNDAGTISVTGTTFKNCSAASSDLFLSGW